MKMKNNPELRFISHSGIDLRKYDQCVENASHSLVYACSWFLDHMAGEWDALVWGDYSYVMPVASRIKWGIRYVYQPVFAQQLGIFPVPPVEIQKAFFEMLKKRFRYIHYQTGCDISEDALKNFTIKSLHTRILSLEPDYSILSQHYDDYITQNLKKAVLNGIRVTRQTSADSFFRLQQLSRQIPVPEKSWKYLRNLMETTLAAGTGQIYTAAEDDSKILAAAFFLVYRNRAYYMTVVSDSKGREKRAGFALLDQFIRDYTGQPILLDFEGSSVEGVDKYFESFGAEKENYLMLSYNRLPWFLRLFKK